MKRSKKEDKLNRLEYRFIMKNKKHILFWKTLVSGKKKT